MADQKPAAGPTQPVVVQGQPLVTAPVLPTKPHRLRPGMKHLHNGAAVKPGEVVELTEQQAKAFLDKFEPTYHHTVPPKVEPPQPRAADTPGIPQDIGAKTPDYGSTPNNPGNLTGGLAPGTTAKL